MYTVNIHGSCVSRGIFDISQIGSDNFEVNEYIAKNTIFSSLSNPLHLSMFECVTDPHSLDWNTRMVYYDFTKTAIESLCKNKSDILIIDLIDHRLGLIKIDDSIITNSESLNRMNIYDVLGEYETISISQFNYYDIYNLFYDYSLKIKQAYGPKQIFIIEAYPVFLYYSKDGQLIRFEDEKISKTASLIEMYEKQYKVLKEVFQGCNVIQMPRNIMADESHRFGLAGNHFEKSFMI